MWANHLALSPPVNLSQDPPLGYTGTLDLEVKASQRSKTHYGLD